MEEINSSLKDQLKEIQESLDDRSCVQPQESEEIVQDEADRPQQIVELQNEMVSSNVAMQNIDIHEENMAELLANCEGIGYI